MASRALNMRNVQIAISDTNEFLQDIPNCFEVGSDSKLHHQYNRVNVFTHKKNFFADAYPEVLKVENMEAFALLKQRLLTLPIYMHVHLERHRRSGNTRIITHGDYVVMINTKQEDIQRQLLEKLNEAEGMMQEETKFALEINFEEALKGWFSSRFDGGWGSYYARSSSFCITNFSQRSKYFKMPLCWVLCFPCCLVAAPIHCAYRAMLSEDSDLNIRSSVTYVKGTTPTQRAEIRNLVRAAYAHGLANSSQNRQMDQQMYEQSYQQVPAPPPGYSGQIEGKEFGPPPAYTSTPPQPPNDNDDPMLTNIA